MNMKWDIAFLVRNYPREYRFADQNYIMVDVHQRHWTSCRNTQLAGALKSQLFSPELPRIPTWLFYTEQKLPGRTTQ